jgi:hypothetical protein
VIIFSVLNLNSSPSDEVKEHEMSMVCSTNWIQALCLVEKMEGKKPSGRPINRWKKTIKMDNKR